MPFQKIYECICDYCGECNYHIYDKSSISLKDLRDAGYVIVMNRIYCSKDCYSKAKKENVKN